MKLALLQLNYTIGDLHSNAEKIIKAVKSVKGNVDLCVTSELALTGYPPKDLLMYDGFVDECMRMLQYVAHALKTSPALLLGCIVRNTSGTGKPLYNAAAFIEHGEVKHYFYKSLIPTYDVFDEDRYFEPGRDSTVLEFKGKKLGITICEDVWNHDSTWRFPRYATNPLEKLAKGHVDAIINLSASPYFMQKQTTIREPLMKAWVKKYAIPFYYVNQVGGNDELIFDGSSFQLDKFGVCVAKAHAFEEAILLVELDTNQSAAEKGKESTGSNGSIEEELFNALVCGTRDYLKKCGFKKALLGLSGGIDSALVLVIAARALGPENIQAVLMPSIYSSQGSLDDAMTLAKTLGVTTHVLPISDLMQGYEHSLKDVFLGHSEDTTEENLQSRIRGNLLMAMSNKHHAALLTTGNKSELSVGYCTIYGDMCGGLAVISDVYKTMVYRLSKWINAAGGREIIPESIIMKAPSAELRPNQSDQDSLPPYDVLDAILYHYIELHQCKKEIINAGFDENIVTQIIQLVTKAEFKRRQAAPGLKVTARAYGTGWRMPIAAKLPQG